MPQPLVRAGLRAAHAAEANEREAVFARQCGLLATERARDSSTERTGQNVTFATFAPDSLPEWNAFERG